MNLGIEYLIRTGIIRDLIDTPCSMFLTHVWNKSRMIVTIEDDMDHYLVKHWHVEDAGRGIPDFESYEVRKPDLFISPATVVQNYMLLPYKESPIPTRYNHYSRPMDEMVYNSLYRDSLNSTANKQRRQKWLWRCFSKPSSASSYSSVNHLPSNSVMTDEQMRMKKFNPERWEIWQRWCQRMLCHKSKSASELVFYREYEDRISELLSEIIVSSSAYASSYSSASW